MTTFASVRQGVKLLADTGLITLKNILQKATFPNFVPPSRLIVFLNSLHAG